MTREEYILLYEKCHSGNCTEREKQMLEEYQDDFLLEEAFWDSEKLGKEDDINGSIYKKLNKSIRAQQVRKISWYKLPLAAAIALATLSLGLYFYINRTEDLIEPIPVVSTPIKPGGNKAVLILEDGSKLELDQSANGVLASQGSSVIKKESDGKLVYNTPANASQPLKYNSISIPRGGQYQLVLPDGSKVWLNAESSLRFPVAFTGKDRIVELLGEAYFEIAKDKTKPFHVMANGTEVEVLGTHFNVNAYNKTVNTTLTEGSVRLKNLNNEAVLKPGQSAITETSGFKVNPADLESILAWKNGFFIFHDENLRSIMEKVSRWYDVEVEYRGDVQQKEFYGKVSRYKQVNELLKNMELTGMVHFKIQGRRVIVMR